MSMVRAPWRRRGPGRTGAPAPARQRAVPTRSASDPLVVMRLPCTETVVSGRPTRRGAAARRAGRGALPSGGCGARVSRRASGHAPTTPAPLPVTLTLATSPSDATEQVDVEVGTELSESAPTFITRRYPRSVLRDLRPRPLPGPCEQGGRTSASAASMAAALSMCRRGTTSTWTGAAGSRRETQR